MPAEGLASITQDVVRNPPGLSLFICPDFPPQQMLNLVVLYRRTA